VFGDHPGMPVDFLFLSQDDVVAAGGTDMPAVIDVIEGAFRLKADGQVINPNKVMLTWSDEPGTQEVHGRIMAMPAWVGGEWDVAGMKWIPSVPANLQRGLPRATALVLLSDRETGLPLAVMDGTVISAMRTGAVTGVAIRYLARPDARTAGLLGAGVLTRTQLMALASERPGLEVARVYDPNTARTEALVAELRPALPFPVAVAESEREACDGADVIIPSTLAVTPTIAKEWVPEGGLVVLVSSLDGPEDLHTVTDLLVVDDRDHEGTADTRYLRRLRDAGIPAADEAVDLAEVVSGAHPGRTAASQRIVCSPVGLGMDDVVTGAYVLRNARERGLGTSLRLREQPLWM
jgi:ornithine cyclodeaminase